MANLLEVENKITSLVKRHAELDKKLFKDGVFDGFVNDAIDLVDAELKELRPRRAALLAGHTDPAEASSKAAPVATPQLRPPRWITTKENRAAAAEIHKQNVEVALTLPLDTPQEDIQDLYATEARVALVESTLREYATEIVENGRACEFSEGMYAALVAMLWRESASTAATFHFAGNQRRLLEQRVEALESMPSDRSFTSAQLQRLTAYLTPEFGQEALLKRIESLEQQRSAMKYLGVWSEHQQYVPGNFCTDKGSVWHCNQMTRERPGDGQSWTLAVKKGQDGKDGRK